MTYRHVLQRFPIERKEDETHGDFMDRVSDIAEENRVSIGGDYCLDVEEFTSYIWGYNGDKDEVKTAVVEIYEIPQKIPCDFFSLLMFHDEVKKEDELGITDISLDDAEDALIDQINLMKATLHHIRNLQQRTNDL